jgi:hypothetical protein
MIERRVAFPPEEIVPFQFGRGLVPGATHCRGTLLLASRQTLRNRGHFDRYLAALSPADAAAIDAAIAAAWLPIELGIAHYRACDALNLSVDETLSIGGEVVRNLQRTFIGSLVKAASSGAGVTPIFGLQRFTTIYFRTIKGGDARVVRYAPKDARVEFVGLPFSAIRYFRIAYRGFIQAGCELFARRVIVAELNAYLGPTTCAYRIAWV